ncbi:MAG: hypothetical protein WAK41_22280 [Roseiarcus sp.]|uniref:hypothetical protein n=1 Tax=Roseiarcus sp. TaxID=1969460 RepID=UPI003BB047D6
MGWSTVNNVPASIDTMLLLTDGSVMAHVLASSSWYRLIPDTSGSYASGTWKQTASMLSDSNMPAGQNGPTYGPVFFGSAVLQDGTVIVYGGEYNVQYSANSNAVDALEVQLYDPTIDSWTILPNPPGWSNIGDPASAVLADGRVLFGNPNNAAMALFDPQTQAYFFTSAKNDNSSEETLTLLPTGDVLTAQCSNGANAEMYTPSTDVWLQMGSTGVSLPQSCPGQGAEIGPAILLPNGNVFAIGATGNTAIYTPGAAGVAGTWSNGPALVDTTNNNTTLFPMDAPAVLLTNGQVLVTGSPSPPCSYPGPTKFLLYNPSTNKAPIFTGPTNNSTACFEGRFLLLPSGEVLYSNQSSTISILASVGGAQGGWAPTITNCPNSLILGHTYQIFGTQFNGLSQACSYGDDAQMATNYPIVRLQDSSNNVYYLRTANHSTMAVATGAATVSTFVSVPTNIPLGQYNLFVVANGIPSAPFAVSVGAQDLVVRLEMSNFTVGEVTAQQNLTGAGNFNDALYVEIEGFSQNDIGSTVPSVAPPIGGLTYASTGPGSPSDPTLPSNQPQRWTFPFQAQFTGTGMFTASDQTLVVSAQFAAAGKTVTGNAQIVLQQTPNPYMFHGGSGAGAEWYLSVDIKVFQLKAGDKMFGLTAGQGTSPQDGATTWIQKTIDNLNGDPAGLGPVFDALPTNDEDTAALNLLQTDSSGNNIYNFALARVRFQDTQSAPNVSLFFRMFAAQQVATTYDPTTTYKSYTSGSTVVPVLGLQGDEIVTIPFFAAPRVNASQALSGQPDPKNTHTINPDPLGAEVDTFYGCWLDINQPNDLRFPDRMVGNTPADYAYGPYGSFNNLVSILQLVRSQHECLVCEVSFAPDPITVGDDPSNTDKLAQRNLAFVSSANPGVDPSRLIPQTFELKPSPKAFKIDQKPDELVIDWGNVPSGSVAQVYLPGTTSAAILAWAGKLYTTHNLKAFDPHTIQVNAGGTTYIPIPKGTDVNFAGLLSLQLPAGVKKGDKYEVVVRQITSNDYTEPVIQIQEARKRTRRAQAQAAAPPNQYAWRHTSGIFRLTIPVDTKTDLIEREERYYAILQFIANSIPTASRWFPVFERYLKQVGGRVRGFGGDPGLIPPSGTGHLPGDGHKPEPCEGEPLTEFVGKVRGLIYDHFGDFEGFTLDEGCGRVRRFQSRERRMARVIREAWSDRATVIVLASARDECCPVKVIVGGEPPDCC